MSLLSRLFGSCFRCPWSNQPATKKPVYRPVDTADDDDIDDEPHSAISGDDWLDDVNETRISIDGRESPQPIDEKSSKQPTKQSEKHQKHRIDNTGNHTQNTSSTGLASLSSMFSSKPSDLKPVDLKLPPPPLDVPSHYYKQREADEKRRREGEALEVVTVGEFVPTGNELDIDAFYRDLQGPQSGSNTPINQSLNQSTNQSTRNRPGVLNEMDLDDLLDELDVGGI